MWFSLDSVSRDDSVRLRKVQNVISERQLNWMDFGVSYLRFSVSLYGDVEKPIDGCTINHFYLARLTLIHTDLIFGVATVY